MEELPDLLSMYKPESDRTVFDNCKAFMGIVEKKKKPYRSIDDDWE